MLNFVQHQILDPFVFQGTLFSFRRIMRFGVNHNPLETKTLTWRIFEVNLTIFFASARFLLHAYLLIFSRSLSVFNMSDKVAEKMITLKL